MAETAWTEQGFRVLVELSGGGILLTCQSHYLSVDKDVVRRPTTFLSRVVVFAFTPRSDAERMVKHWLAFFGDEKLASDGLNAFREAFNSVPEPSPQEALASPQGTMN